MRVLSLIHQDNARSGSFGEAVSGRGGEHLEWNVSNGAPPDPESFDAVFVFGGSMHVDQEKKHPWLRQEDDLLRGFLSERVPIFGVCLGGQLIAKVAGAGVGPALQEEVGWHEVELTPEAARDPVFAGVPTRFQAFQWHEYAFQLPDGAVPLARNSIGLQAYRLGDSAWGIQFHAEVTEEVVRSWQAGSSDRREFDFSPMKPWARLGRGLADRFLEYSARRPRRARRATTRAS